MLLGRESAENPSLFYPNLSVRVRLAGIFLPSYSLEQPGPRRADPASFRMEVEKQLCPVRARSTGKVPQDPGAPLPQELPKIQAKNAQKILVLAFPSSSRLDFPAFDQIFQIIPTSDTKITLRLRDGALGAAPTEIFPLGEHPWIAAFTSQLEHSSTRAKPRLAAREPARDAGNIHPTCWKHGAAIPYG